MPTEAGGSRQQSGRVVRCTSTSGAGGRGLVGAGAVAAAVAVRRGGMAHAAKAARQQPANERARLARRLDINRSILIIYIAPAHARFRDDMDGDAKAAHRPLRPAAPAHSPLRRGSH